MKLDPSDTPLPSSNGVIESAGSKGDQPHSDNAEAARIKALAFEAVSEGVVITDALQRVMLVNPAFEAITGYASADLVGSTCGVLQGPLTRSETVIEIAQALRQDLSFSGHILNYRKDRSTFWNELSISALRDANGQITHFIGLMRDISERKHAEAQLQEAEIRYRHATEAAGGYLLDVDTSFRYTFVSQSVEQLLGYAPSELLGHTPAEFMPAGELEKVNAWFTTHFREDGSVHGLEHRVVTKSGSVIWLQISRIPIRDSHGSTIGYRGIGFDITARKKAEIAGEEQETQTRETQKMEAIGTLAGGIAHDFNNIIAAILGNVSLAREDLEPTSPALQSLDEIDKAASRARDLVRQILAFSRRQNTEYASLSLVPVVNETARMLRALLPARVAIEVECASAVPEVSGDTSQIQQVIVNLATNAMQAMGDRPGSIRIDLDGKQPKEKVFAKHPKLRAMLKRHPDGLVCLSVSDDGPGIDEATLSRIFEPFFTTKPVGEGTGLGLAVVHGIAQGHKGLVLVESQLGHGTQFSLYLPASATAASDKKKDPEVLGSPRPPTAAALTHANGNAPSIIYIDDDEALLLLVKRLLARRGLRVTTFHDQQQALAAIRSAPESIDLVLSDYNMPGMSGLDLARESLSIRADLPVVITSGFIDEKLSAEATSAGVHKLIFKAVAVDEFCEAIEALLVKNP